MAPLIPPSIGTPIGFLSITAEEFQKLVGEIVRHEISEALAQVRGVPLPLSEELMTREETARVLHVNVRTLRTYEIKRTLQPRRSGRRVLYHREDVLAYLNARDPDIKP